VSVESDEGDREQRSLSLMAHAAAMNNKLRRDSVPAYRNLRKKALMATHNCCVRNATQHLSALRAYEENSMTELPLCREFYLPSFEPPMPTDVSRILRRKAAGCTSRGRL